MSLRRVIALVALSSPVILFGACSKKKSGGGGGGDGSTPPGTVATAGPGGGQVPEPTYKPSTTPTKVAPIIPGTVAVEAGALKMKFRLDEDKSNEASAQKAEGYERLHEKIQELGPQLVDLALNVYLFDSVVAGLKAACASLPCTTNDVTATLTADMAEAVLYAAGGAAHLTDGVKKKIADQINTPVDLGDVTLKAPPANSGFDTCVTVVENASYSTSYCYSKTLISADTRYVEGDVVGSYSLKYDLAKDILVMVDESLEGQTKERDSFTLQGNPSSANPSGIIADIELRGIEPSYGTWGARLKVIADSVGGVVDTDYHWEEQTITAFNTSAPTGDGTAYYLLPGNATAGATHHDALGYVEGQGTDDMTNYVYYFGPITVPASLKLFTIGADDAEGNPVLTDSGLTATLALTNDQKHFFYVEEFGPTGNVTYTCAKQARALTACDYSEGTAGPYVAALQAETFGFGSALLTVVFTGAGANAAAMGGETFYVMPGTVDLSTQNPAVVGYVLPDALAWGIFGGDPENLSATTMAGYDTEVFAATAGEFTGARVWKVAYDGNGDPYFAEVTNVTVSTGP